MPKVTVDFSQAGEGGGISDRVPAGFYRLQCVKAVHQKNSAGDAMVIATEWRVRGPQNAGAKVVKSFSLTAKSAFFLRQCLTSMGFKVPQSPRVSVDTDAMLRKEVGARIGDGDLPARGSFQKRTISEIKEFMTLADYEAQRTPSRNGAPSLQEAISEADEVQSDEEFEYEDPEEKEDEEEVEEITL